MLIIKLNLKNASPDKEEHKKRILLQEWELFCSHRPNIEWEEVEELVYTQEFNNDLYIHPEKEFNNYLIVLNSETYKLSTKDV